LIELEQELSGIVASRHYFCERLGGLNKKEAGIAARFHQINL
jgi:hypothetical protein